MSLLTSQGGGRYDVDPQDGNSPGWARSFADRYNWSYAENSVDMPAESLLFASTNEELAFRFWPDGGLVQLFAPRQNPVWLRAEPKDDPGGHPYESIFSHMRAWYDVPHHPRL